ncbi:MAG TPA: thioredoxin [Bauldia sp.]
MAILPVTAASFDSQVLGAALPVVVDFTAEWCPPCHAIAPSLEALSDELAGRVKIVRLDVDIDPSISARYGVRSMPTLMMFKNGEPTAIQVGAAPKGRLSDWIVSAI